MAIVSGDSNTAKSPKAPSQTERMALWRSSFDRVITVLLFFRLWETPKTKGGSGAATGEPTSRLQAVRREASLWKVEFDTSTDVAEVRSRQQLSSD